MKSAKLENALLDLASNQYWRFAFNGRQSNFQHQPVGKGPPLVPSSTLPEIEDLIRNQPTPLTAHVWRPRSATAPRGIWTSAFGLLFTEDSVPRLREKLD